MFWRRKLEETNSTVGAGSVLVGGSLRGKEIFSNRGRRMGLTERERRLYESLNAWWTRSARKLKQGEGVSVGGRGLNLR